jgi:acetyl/propionyl-CoA carboxylase alpha subunit
VGTRYDPLLAKLVADGSTREEALDRLAAALAETEVEGVVTNLPFLRWLVAHPVFRAGEATTAFLAEHPPLSAPMPGTVIQVHVAAGAQVTARQPLVVLEAMKMETPLLAPYDATVSAVHVAEGDRVGGGTVLVELETA